MHIGYSLTKSITIGALASLGILCGCTADRNNPNDSGGGNYQPLTAPTSLTYVLTADSVEISWTDNNTHGSGFYVKMGNDTNNLARIDTLEAGEASFQIYFPNPDTVFFTVSVFDSKAVMESRPIAVMRPVGPDWVQLGGSVGHVATTDLLPSDMYVSPRDTVYIVEVDTARLLWCFKFNGIGWDVVGGAVGTGYAPRVTMVGNQPFVVFRDTGDGSGGGTVQARRFDGQQWQDYYSQGGLAGPRIQDLDVDVYNDVPYIAFAVDSPSTASCVSVSKFGPGIWVPVGQKGFFADVDPATVRISIATAGRAYISGQASSGEVYCYSFDGSAWTIMGGGPAGVELPMGSKVSLGISGDTCYVAYDQENSPFAVARAIGAGAWTVIGSIAEISAGENIDMAIVNGVPYVAFADYANQLKVSVLRYSNTGWTNAGRQFVSPSWYPRSIRLESNGDRLYLSCAYNEPPQSVLVYTFR